MVPKKSKSKRLSLKLKHRIAKSAKNHARKLRKTLRNNPNLARRRRKDPGIPNLCPFKEALLRDIDDKSERLKAMAERQKAQRKRILTEARLRAQQVDTHIERKAPPSRSLASTRPDPNALKWYTKELAKVIDASDVVLWVLDARDPMGGRSPRIERAILSQLSTDRSGAKRIILVLNKSDMVPVDNVESWVRYLRREYPTVAFKSATNQKAGQHIKQNKSRSMINRREQRQSGAAAGVAALLGILKNYQRTATRKDMGEVDEQDSTVDNKRGLTVGVVGYPNVGKSSIINSLKRTKACGVASTPGFTKSLQTVKIDRFVDMIDSPGVLFNNLAANQETFDGSMVLRNALSVQQIEDPVFVASQLIQRLDPLFLQRTYSVSSFRTPEQFLSLVARARGQIGKGHVPRVDAAARTVLRDWQIGKIPFYTQPPETQDVIESKVVTEWREAFDVDRLDKEMFGGGGKSKSKSSSGKGVGAMAPMHAVLDFGNGESSNQSTDGGSGDSVMPTSFQLNHDKLNEQLAKKNNSESTSGGGNGDAGGDNQAMDEMEDAPYDFARDF